jgi:hypothetical protein
MLQLQLKNMFILMEENKDLREELESLKSITHDKKVKNIIEENKSLQKRNGQLLVELDDTKLKIKEVQN